MQEVSRTPYGHFRECLSLYSIHFIYTNLFIDFFCFQTKKQHVGEEALTSDIVGQAVVEKSALKLFEKADDDDRQSRFNKYILH